MPSKQSGRILKLLAREFEYSQALHVEREDIARKLSIEDNEALVESLKQLEKEGFVNLWIDYRGILKLAKITWKGLNKFGEVNLRYGLDKSTS